MPKLPPPGASSIGSDGARTQVSSETRPGVVTPGRPDGAKRISPYTPHIGAKLHQVQMYEVPLHSTVNPNHLAEYRSIDGQDYSFSTHDSRGKPLVRRETLALFLGMREVALGGNPAAVLNAFRLNIQDRNGKPVFPVIISPVEEAPEDIPGYTLGE